MADKFTIKEKILLAFEGRKGQVFKPHEIIDIVLQKFPGTNKSSIQPADRCYNRINKGIKIDFHVFESNEDGSYLYLGKGYPYNGPVYWKGKKVGVMKNGGLLSTLDCSVNLERSDDGFKKYI